MLRLLFVAIAVGALGCSLCRTSRQRTDTGPPTPSGEVAPLAPLDAAEQSTCTRAAIEGVFRDIATDRFAVITLVPVYRISTGRVRRTCKIELFDYPKNTDLQATIDLATSTPLNSRRLKDVQPAIGESEIPVARSIAETAPEARKALSRLLDRSLERLDVSAMVRTDAQQCRFHRCIELDYYETGVVAGTTAAAEPTTQQVQWRPITPVAQVIVDLTSTAMLLVRTL